MTAIEQTKTPLEILTASASLDRVCVDCGQPFAIEPQFVRIAKFVKACPECVEATIAAEFKSDAAKASQRTAIDVSGWHRLCPEDFLELDMARHPRPDRHAQVMEWQFGFNGIVLHSKTGHGKSRSLYALLRREFYAGRTIAICDHTSGIQYADAYADGPDAARLWFEHRCKVDILALDDVFKVKLTDSFEQVLFQIISFRTERRRPLLITTNDVGAELEKRMTPDRGPALVRRIRDYCKSIPF